MNKFTITQFLKAIPGSGGIVSVIAKSVGCDWHTAKKYIDEHSSVKRAWTDERNIVTDKAQHNILRAINEGDLQMSKWWLSVMSDEFAEKSKLDIASANGVKIEVEYVNTPYPAAELPSGAGGYPSQSQPV